MFARRSLLFAAVLLALPMGCAGAGSSLGASAAPRVTTVIGCDRHPVHGKWRCQWTTDTDYAAAPSAVTPAS